MAPVVLAAVDAASREVFEILGVRPCVEQRQVLDIVGEVLGNVAPHLGAAAGRLSVYWSICVKVCHFRSGSFLDRRRAAGGPLATRRASGAAPLAGATPAS